MKYMLSFTRGKPVALVLGRSGAILHTLHVVECKDNEEPDIEVDDPVSLIDKVDIDKVKRAMKLGLIETKILMKAVRTQDPSRLSEQLKRAYESLIEKADDKLKTEINFEDDSDVECVIPALGYNSKPFDRSMLFVGPSGAGKSYLAKKIMVNDKRNRPVALFSKVVDDVSLKEIKDQKLPDGKSRLIEVPLFSADDLVNIPMEDDLKRTLTFFDDIDALGGESGEFLRQYRDALLEAGRHKDITTLSTSHILNNYGKTRTLLNEAEWVFCFPNASRISCNNFLKDRLGIDKADRDHLIERAARAGRYLGAKMSAPNAIIHQKGILLL